MKSLVIIGNGFDLGHSLLTTFDNFINSDKKFHEKYKVFKGLDWNNVESNYKDILFEIMLEREDADVGEILENIINDYGFDEYGNISYVHLSSDNYFSEINKIKGLVNLLTEFENDFCSYLKGLCNQDRLSTIAPKMKIDKILQSSSYIINFNYTNVIEEVYKVNRVRYIHGNIFDKNIAIGTNAIDELKESMIDGRFPTEYPCKDKYDYQERMKYYDEGSDGQLYLNEQLKKLFDEIENSIEKNEKDLFTIMDAKNKDTLFSRQEVKKFLEKNSFDEVYVLGHSIGDADISVFEKINKESKLSCYFYEKMNDVDLKRMKDRLDSLKIDYKLIPNNGLYI